MNDLWYRKFILGEFNEAFMQDMRENDIESLRRIGAEYMRARLTEESFARAIFSPGEVRISKSFFIKRERIERMCSV